MTMGHITNTHRPSSGEAGRAGPLGAPRIVLIGRPFAVPYLWIPAHLLCAAAKPEASAT